VPTSGGADLVRHPTFCPRFLRPRYDNVLITRAILLLNRNDPAARPAPRDHRARRPHDAAPDTHLVPALIAAAGEQAAWRYVEFFTANIRNTHIRRAYARACGRFFAWCEDRAWR